MKTLTILRMKIYPEIRTMDSQEIRQAVTLLCNDEVVGIPTETVYGLAASLFSEKAIEKIYAIKGRPKTNPLIVHVGREEDLTKLCQSIPEPLQQLIHRFWPGPLTILVEKSDQVPRSITAGSNRVGIRMPDHPLTLELLGSLPFPLVAPSANPYNAISPTTAKHVRDYFSKEVPLILDGGPCQQGLESTVVGMENGQVVIYRQGMISEEQIQDVVRSVTGACGITSVTLQTKIREKSLPGDADRSIQIAPGMTLKHYAPNTPTLVCQYPENHKDTSEGKAFVFFCKKHPELPQEHQYLLSEKGDLNEAAASLYQLLHELDKKSYRQIICELFPDDGIGRAINDRLMRAGGGIISQ